KLKFFLMDGGGEFASKKFTDWMKDRRITHQHSRSYELEQNGAAERLHRTVGDMAFTVLIGSGLPDKFWSFAYMWDYFTHNRIVNSLTGNKTRLELTFGQTPVFDQLCTSGEVAFVHKPHHL
ncbi:uncharacterized protein VP01_6325g2, partial [Puccinia sorghi]